MKLIIQIPCFNEAGTLAAALGDLPREVPGFEVVEWLVVDDGSTDATRQVARDHGVDHVVGHTSNQGLARAFMTGLDACLQRGADVIVNTDADNQYDAAGIPALVAPVLAGAADIVVGERPIRVIRHFSPLKKALQKLGSWAVQVASKTAIPDAPSGFRAISRTAAQRLVVFSDYTYTLETIIQAGRKNIAITSVPVEVNDELRPSRLVTSIGIYVTRSVATIVRVFIIYRPFRFFASFAAVCFLAGFAIGVRFLVFYLGGDGSGHVQSLLLATLLMGAGFHLFVTAFVADLLAANRMLLEELLYRARIADRRAPPPTDPGMAPPGES